MYTKTKNILILIFSIIVTTSCENYLDVTSSTEIDSDEQFASENGFKDALLGVYIGMTAPELYSKDMTWNIIDLLGQQYAPLTSPAQYDEIQQYKYKTTSSSRQIGALWKKSYNIIANINNTLGNLETKREVLDAINYSIIKGELLGLRAFIHFDLMRLYGYGNIANRSDITGKYAIPYVTKYTNDLTPQLSYMDTFERMKNDIDQALELLKEDPIYPNSERSANYYENVNREGFYNKREQRMNYYAVKALQARMLIWQGGMENMNAARLAAEEVIGYSFAQLIVSDSYPVSLDPILYPEILFSLNVMGFEDIVNRYLDANNASNYDALYMATSTANQIYETSNVNIGIADIRYNTLLDAQTPGFVSIKLFHNGKNTNANQMPLIKLPEMYYIAAEYYIDTDLAKAIEYLNIVRSSRGIIEEIPLTADVDTVKNELFKEYRKEYVSEGQLFFYYKRVGATSIPGLSVNTVVGDAIYLLPYPDSELQFGYNQ